jgi:hypothetical protein
MTASGPAGAEGLLHPMRPRRDDRRLARPPGFALRRLTAPLRRRPDFVVAGAMKAGTSSLFGYLLRHPLVVPPLRKEVHFFTAGHRAGLGEGWYRAHFALRSWRRDARITGEATPGYMFEPDALGRLATSLPGIRVIVVLREPVARAVSHWRHEVAMGRETLPFEEAIALEDERRRRAALAGEAGRETFLHASYKARSRYLEQIMRVQAAFPSDRLLILGSDALRRDPGGTVGMAFRHLGLPPAPLGPPIRKNASRDREEVPERTLAALREEFAPHNARLFDHLGFRPDW